jgi:hypothetical protein
MPNIDLSTQELAILAECLDIAVKAGGLRVAEPVLPVVKKIKAQVPQPTVPPKKEDGKEDEGKKTESNTGAA